MSEEQALETENEIIEEELIEETADAGEAEAIEEDEIFVEGEEQPASIPLHALHKRLGREKRKTNAANTEADEARRKAEMLEEENKLLRLQQAQQTQSTKRPSEDDFDSIAEYEAALDKYDSERIEKVASEKVAQFVQANEAKAVQSQSKGNLNQQIDKHYERSASLKVSDYSETETIAADVLGDDIAEQIVANTEESHLLMYHLGKNPAKAERLKALIESNPLKGVMEIGRLAGSLKVKPKHSIAPDPETTIENGNTVSSVSGVAGV